MHNSALGTLEWFLTFFKLIDKSKSFLDLADLDNLHAALGAELVLTWQSNQENTFLETVRTVA